MFSDSDSMNCDFSGVPESDDGNESSRTVDSDSCSDLTSQDDTFDSDNESYVWDCSSGDSITASEIIFDGILESDLDEDEIDDFSRCTDAYGIFNRYAGSYTSFSDSDEMYEPPVLSFEPDVIRCDVEDPQDRNVSKRHEMREHNDEEGCINCSFSRPLTLQKLCGQKIACSPKLTEAACSLVPRHLLELLLLTAIQISENYAETSLHTLIQHWPFPVLNLSSNISIQITINSLIKSVLDRFSADLSREKEVQILPKFKDFIYLLCKSDDDDFKFFEDGYNIDHHPFFYALSKPDNRRIITDNINTTSQARYIIVTDVVVDRYNSKGYNDTVSVLNLCKQQGSPFEIRIARILSNEIRPSKLSEIFSGSNPQYLKSFSAKRNKFTAQDILELDQLLISCFNLSSLTLFQMARHIGDENSYTEELANAMSSLLGHHPNITKLTLAGFPVAGHIEKYHLPQSLKELHMNSCPMTDEDWTYWADQSDVASLNVLSIVCCPHDIQNYTEGIVRFIQKQVATLTDIEIVREQQPLTVANLKFLAQHFAQSQRLERFLYRVENNENTLEIIQAIMPGFLVIDSLKSFVLETKSRLLGNTGFSECLTALVARIGTTRKKPIDEIIIRGLVELSSLPWLI